MTSSEFNAAKAGVIELARKRAGGLNIPWGEQIIAKPMIPFWPSGPTWRVFSIRSSERLVVTMWVNCRTGRAKPRSAIYYADARKFEKRLKSLKLANA